MSVISIKFPQTTWQKNITGSLVLACCALTIVGCNRSDPSKQSANPSDAASTQADNTSTVACNSEKATTAISRYIENRVKQQATNQAQLIEQQANTTVDMTILNNNLSQLAVSLENVTVSDNKCQATVSFNLPQSQLDSADKIYTRLGLPVIAEQVSNRGYQLKNSTIITKNINFGVSGEGANYQVNTTTGDDAIGLVGEIIANATLAQTLTGPSNMTTTGTPPTAIIPQTSSQTSSRHTTDDKLATVKPTTVKKPTTTNTNTKSVPQNSSTNTTKTVTKYTTTEETRKITPVSKDNKAVKPAETKPNTNVNVNANKDNPKPASDKKPTTSPSTDRATKPVTHEKVPTDSTIKLTIEEKNEQY